MNQTTVTQIEQSNPGFKGIQSDAAGLAYFIAGGDPRIAVAGQHGIAILTRSQAEAVARELGEIVQLFL